MKLINTRLRKHKFLEKESVAEKNKTMMNRDSVLTRVATGAAVGGAIGGAVGEI